MIMFVYLLFISLCCSTINSLRWNNSGFSNWEASKVINLKSTVDSPKVDVSSGDQITIVFNIRPYSKNIAVYCFIAGYNNKSEIVYSFCKNDNDCTVTVKDGSIGETMNAYNMAFRLDTVFAGRKGFKVEFRLPDQMVDVSGNYFCKANDRAGNFMIRSNNIQIRDRLFWETNLVLNTDRLRSQNTPDVRRDGLPRTFPCSPTGLRFNPLKPEWIDQEFERPVSWSICPVKNGYDSLKAGEKATFSNCERYTISRWNDPDETLKPFNMKDMKQWTFYVDTNGDLNIFTIKLEPNPPTMSYALLCYRDSQNVGSLMPINTYIKQSNDDDIISGVVFNATTVDYTRTLTAISPLVQSVNIYARSVTKQRDATVHTVSIFVKYEASSSATAQWYFNGAVLNIGENIKTNNYQVMFDNDITSEMAGNYSLDVRSGADKLTMTIMVSVLGPPKLKDVNCLPLIRYVWEFDSTSFYCTYGERPEELKLQINAEEIAFDRPLPETRTSLEKSYPYLSLLNFTISQTKSDSTNEASLNYTVYDMKKTRGQTIYQDHSVMFFVKNKFGLSVKSTSIYTVPKLRERVLISPESKNCTVACSSETRHEFQCRIDVAQFLNKELIIDYYWSINGHRLEQVGNPENQFAPYFIVDPFTKDLVLLPIKSNMTDRDKFVKDALKSNVIECHFDLMSTTDASPRFIYYSKDDASLGSLLRAKITIDYQPLNMAFVYWIVAVILALIILIILIVLLTRYCMRNKGETYPLDKIERKHGYDPEKEVQEEMFKPYEREEHEPDFMSDNSGDRKLSMSHNSVGSADDGELDAYDLDPSNFNEDGSIIGKYGANPRSRAAMT